MFYLKYRPQQFKDLVGLDTISKTLLSQLREGKVGHAYIFSGPKGTGKTSTARILAKSLNCLKPGKTGEPCSRCDVCLQVSGGRFLDLYEIDAASNRGIDDIRLLRERINLSPSQGKYKVYIIDEAHMLTQEAFNALLKTLEEPPPHALFILATTEPHKIPKTILSRCQRFNFKRPQVSAITEKLKRISEAEGLDIQDSDLTAIAKAGGGAFRDAETLLEQVAAGVDVESVISGFDLGSIHTFFDFLLNRDLQEAIRFVNTINDKGVDLERFLEHILDYLRDILLVKAQVGELVEKQTEDMETLKRQSAEVSFDALRTMIDIFSRAYENIEVSSIPSLPIEVAVVEVASEAESTQMGQIGTDQTDRKSRYAKGKPPGEPLGLTGKPPGVEEGVDGLADKLIKEVKPLNQSVEALLRSCEVLEKEGKIIIVARYEFHKDKLGADSSREVLSKAIESVWGEPKEFEVRLKNTD